MGRAIIFAAVSLDGFAADDDTVGPVVMCVRGAFLVGNRAVAAHRSAAPGKSSAPSPKFASLTEIVRAPRQPQKRRKPTRLPPSSLSVDMSTT